MNLFLHKLRAVTQPISTPPTYAHHHIFSIILYYICIILFHIANITNFLITSHITFIIKYKLMQMKTTK